MPGQSLADEYIPSTFAERGVAVPFTTPLLNQARLRLDRNDRFEFLLPAFTGGKGVYVLPWKALPEMMTITLHDRLLFEAIEKLETHSPESVRQAALTVAQTGVAGGDAASAAAASLAKDHDYLVLTQFILVTELLRLVGIGAADLLRPGMTIDDSKRMARAALAQVAQMVGLPPDAMTARVETLGVAIAPVGLPQCPEPGRLRTLINRLGRFCRDVERWAELDASDATMLGQYCAAVGKHTLGLARVRMEQLDKVCVEPKQIIHDEPRFRTTITEHVSRLSWLLDGWDFLVALWESARDRTAEAQRTAVGDISRLLPVIPKEETTWTSDTLDMDAVSRVQRRWVRVNEDWRTGALDMDAVMRLESLKAAMV